MSTQLHDERVLNVFRERYPEEETLTTEDLAEELSVHQRTAQNYVNDLANKGCLVLVSEGKPNHWSLSDTEPVDPVYNTQLAKAKRWGNQAAEFGELTFVLGVGALAAAGLVTSNHIFAEVADLYIPLLDTSAASTAVITGMIGSLLFAAASIALLFSVAVPRIVEWHIDNPLPDESSH